MPTSTVEVSTAVLQPTPTLINEAPVIVPATETTVSSTATPIIAPLPTATPLPDTGWVLLHEGMERRQIRLFDENGRLQDRLYLLRIDPNFYQFGIGYHPHEPQSLANWQAETGALVTVNGGFFTEEFIATGRIVVDGVASGLSYEGFGGMIVINGGSIEVRSLVERPYVPNEPSQHALQSFPLLIKPNGELGFPDETGRKARRTVIGQDVNGRILLILTHQSSFTLHQLALYLLQSDLQLHTALNLDGGPSTGLILADPPEEIPAYFNLPTVITIHRNNS